MILNIDTAFQNLVNKIWSTQGIRFDKPILDITIDQITSYFQNGYGHPDVNLNSPDYLRLSCNEANIARFSAAKTAYEVIELNRLKNKFDKFEDFNKAVQQTNITYNHTWLKAEYNTSFTTGQTSADYWKQISTKELFPYVRYETVGDSHVRDAHVALDGKIAAVGSSLHDYFNPPLGYNCRCRLRQMTSDEVSKVSSTKEVKEVLRNIEVGNTNALNVVNKYGFGKNHAKTNEVFTNAQFFIKDFKESGLRFKDYNLKAYDDLKHHTPGYHTIIRSKDEFFNQMKGANDLNNSNAIRLLDYRNRPILYKRAIDFDDARAVQDVLLNPSETWLTKSGELYQRNYLKFFNNKAIRVQVNLSNDMSEQVVRARFEDKIDNFRKGVLVR